MVSNSHEKIYGDVNFACEIEKWVLYINDILIKGSRNPPPRKLGDSHA